MQTSYELYQDDAMAGMKGTSEQSNVITKSAGEEIDFGFGVVVDSTNADKVVLPSGSTDTLIGAAMAEQNEPGLYQENDAVNVITKGTIWLVLDPNANNATIKPHMPAFITSTGADAGKVTDVSTDNLRIGIFRGAPFGLNAGGNIAMVELNLPQNS